MSLEIYKGEDTPVTIRLAGKESGRPHDLTDTEITLRLLKDDDTALEVTDFDLVGDAVLGEFTVTLSRTQTAELKATESLSLEVFLDKAGSRRIVQLKAVGSVRERIAE